MMRRIRWRGGMGLCLPLLLTALAASARQQPHLEAAVAAADRLVQAAVDEELVPGAVLLVAQHGKVLHEKAYGYARRYDYGPKRREVPEPMTTAHLFDLASLTKVFATTFGVMLLVDQQKVELEAPLGRYLPEFRGPTWDSVTVRHLLAHTAGLHPWKPLYFHAADGVEARAYIARLARPFPVGQARHYSDLGFMLLGYLIERVGGQPLDAFLKDQLYEPLGLKATAFNPQAHGFTRFAATSHGNPYEYRMVADDDFGYVCEEDPESFTGWRRYVLAGEVNDGNAYHAHGGVAGHAGLFATASDLQVLVELLLGKGTYAGRRFIRADVVEAFLTKDTFGGGLGWIMGPDLIGVDDLPEGSFAHTGFTGTYAVVLPACGLSLILLTNRQHAGVNAAGYYNDLGPLRKQLTALMIQGARCGEGAAGTAP